MSPTCAANWTLKVGDVFRQSEWETNKRRALQALLITTYPFATLTRTEAQVDVRTSKAKLTVVIASGPVVRFGPLQIIGLKRYPEQTVRNLDPIDLGELYTQQKLFDYQQKLANTGYFSRVEVSIDAEADPGSDPRSAFVAPKVADTATPATPPTPTEANATPAAAAPPSPLPREVTLPVRVLVEENKSKTVSAGVGYTTNSGPRASLAYNVIDFLGGAKQLRTNLVGRPPEPDARCDAAVPDDAARRRLLDRDDGRSPGHPERGRPHRNDLGEARLGTRDDAALHVARLRLRAEGHPRPAAVARRDDRRDPRRDAAADRQPAVADDRLSRQRRGRGRHPPEHRPAVRAPLRQGHPLRPVRRRQHADRAARARPRSQAATRRRCRRRCCSAPAARARCAATATRASACSRAARSPARAT